MLTLIIGGAGQGKLSYALSSRRASQGDVTYDPACPRPIFAGLETYLRQTEDPWPALEALMAAQRDLTILCDEVGCGVIPMDKDDREWRERVGRTCCALAARADRVVRLYCGIPTIIKGV